MNKRLNACLSYLKDINTVMDIGTDHAYLPIEAIKQGLVKNAYAIDNKKGPLMLAEENILKYGLKDKITAVLADGIDTLSEDVDAVVIAGMGGKMIHDILKGKSYLNVKRFILQPNNHPQLVRTLTKNNALKIVDELIVVDQNIPYNIIVLEQGKQALSDKALWISEILFERRDEVYKKMLEEEYVFLEKLLESVPGNARVPLEKKRDLLKEVFDEWQLN